MKKLSTLIVLICSACVAIAKNDSTNQGHAWQFIKLSYAKGFQAYGLSNLEIKDQNFTSVIAAEVNVYKQHGVYAEFINQPMMALTAENGFEELDFFFFSTYYEVFIRSHGFNVGYACTMPLTPRLDVGVRAGVGKTYMEYREYFTNSETFEVSQYEGKDTITNWSIGGMVNYTLPNNLGLFAEAALSQNTPLLKLGLTYKIKSK